MTILSDITTSKITMMTKLCSWVMEVRRDWGTRRSRAQRHMQMWSSMSSRRERARRSRITPRKLIKHILAGRLRRGDEEGIKKLDEVTLGNREELAKCLACLREATMYMDDIVHNPRLTRDLHYKMWSSALDLFITEIRSMISCKQKLDRYDIDIIELLIAKLSQMRISEMSTEQVGIRLSLEDTMESLFNLAIKQRVRLRTTGY